MGFLLGAFGKLQAGRRVRDLQARLMRVQTKMRRATRQVEHMSKALESQKKMELNSLTFMSQAAGTMLPAAAAGALAKDASNPISLTNEEIAAFNTGVGLNATTMDDATKMKYAAYQNVLTNIKAQNEMFIAQQKQQIEERYESLNDLMLEPLKMEEDSLQTEKDSLESQLQIAQGDYEACKKMEQADAKNLAPNYTGQG